MIECQFVYKFSDGGSSDSLNQSYKVHSVPQAGDTISFVGEDGTCTDSEVKEVVHYINPTEGTHEITVFYGDK
jgi:hypothetical protein